jgi:hypothetical protein
MIIIVVTDSLGLPRNTPEEVKLEDTYIDMLREKYKAHKILNVSIGGATIDMLSSQLIHYYNAVNPDLVIFQAGIVDCAPRALKKWETSLLERISIFKKLYNLFIKKHTVKLRQKRGITYTPLDKFSAIVQRIQTAFQDKIYWLGILPATDKYEEQLPGIQYNISKYNHALETLIKGNFISTSDCEPAYVMSDHHHINKLGNLFLYKKLAEVIDAHQQENTTSH